MAINHLSKPLWFSSKSQFDLFSLPEPPLSDEESSVSKVTTVAKAVTRYLLWSFLTLIFFKIHAYPSTLLSLFILTVSESFVPNTK